MLARAFTDSFYNRFVTFTNNTESLSRSASTSSANVLHLDLIFALDTSGSVFQHNFEYVKTFVKNLAKAFALGQHSTHVGAVAFGSTVYFISELTPSKAAFLRSIDEFEYKGGKTNTTAALLAAKDMFISSARNESRLKRILILITDGRSNSNSKQPQSIIPEFARLSIERFVFGIGNVYKPEIDAIASPPIESHVFNVKNFSIFNEFAEFLAPSMYGHKLI